MTTSQRMYDTALNNMREILYSNETNATEKVYALRELESNVIEAFMGAIDRLAYEFLIELREVIKDLKTKKD